MRVNHAGEVSAQGLYQGQALLTRARPDPAIPASARRARKATIWPGARARLRELGARPSLLNPFWYVGSFALGAAAAALGDARQPRASSPRPNGRSRDIWPSHLERLPAADHAQPRGFSSR